MNSTSLDVPNNEFGHVRALVPVDALLCTMNAARVLAVSPRTLEDWRLRGGGPIFRKLGRRTVRYALRDLESFAAEDARTNTAGGRP